MLLPSVPDLPDKQLIANTLQSSLVPLVAPDPGTHLWKGSSSHPSQKTSGNSIQSFLSLQETSGQGGRCFLALFTTNGRVSSPLLCQDNTFHTNLRSLREVRSERESHRAGWCHCFGLEMILRLLCFLRCVYFSLKPSKIRGSVSWLIAWAGASLTPGSSFSRVSQRNDCLHMLSQFYPSCLLGTAYIPSLFCLPLPFLKHFYPTPASFFPRPSLVLVDTFKAALSPSTFFLKTLLSPEVHQKAQQWFGSWRAVQITRLASVWSLQGVGWDGLLPAQLFLLARTEDQEKKKTKTKKRPPLLPPRMQQKTWKPILLLSLKKAQKCPHHFTWHFKHFFFLILVLIQADSSFKNVLKFGYYEVQWQTFLSSAKLPLLTSKILDEQNSSFMFTELSANWKLICSHAPLPGLSVPTRSSHSYLATVLLESADTPLSEPSLFHY